MNKKIKKTAVVVSITGLGILLVVAIYWIAVFGKMVSYKLFYQDMVEETVQRMVKDSVLIKPAK